MPNQIKGNSLGVTRWNLVKVFHRILVHFGCLRYISEVSGYIQAISSHMYSVVDIGKSQYVKSKFKVFHKISVHFVYFPNISEVVGFIPAISSYTHSVVDIGKSQYVKRKSKAFHKISVVLGYF